MLFTTELSTAPSAISPDSTNFRGVAVVLGTAAADVEFAGLVAAGQFQINIVVPNLPHGEHPLTIRYNGQASQSGVVLPVVTP